MTLRYSRSATPVWAELGSPCHAPERGSHARAVRAGSGSLRALLARAGRVCSMDFSRQRIDEDSAGRSCTQLADCVRLRDRIEAMWRGEHIKRTEDRAVLHVALRQPRGAAIGGEDIAQRS